MATTTEGSRSIRTRVKRFGGSLRTQWLVVALIVVLAGLIAANWRTLSNGFNTRPFVSGDKDWIDVFSAIGQAFGLLAIVALLFEMYRRRDDLRTRYMPHLHVHPPETFHAKEPAEAQGSGTNDEVTKAEAAYRARRAQEGGITYCLFEEAGDELERAEQDYRDLKQVAEGRSGDYLSLLIENTQSEFEGSAADVRVRLRLVYSRTDAPNPNVSQAWKKEAWFPQKCHVGMTIPNGRSAVLILKLGKSKYPFLKVEPTSVTCRNNRGDRFDGTRIRCLLESLPLMRYTERED